MVRSFVAKGDRGGGENRAGRGNDNHSLATDRGLFWWDLFLGAQKLPVFFSISVCQSWNNRVKEGNWLNEFLTGLGGGQGW